jgi:hypothetical protein
MVEQTTSEDWPHDANSYSLEYVIGMGSFGIVWRAKVMTGKHTGEVVAIKVIDID